MITIGSNISSLIGQRHQARATDAVGRVFEQLSSGRRINRASDDAAGLAIASSLTANSRVYTQAIRNGNDAISAISIAEGALGQMSTVIMRIRELATQSSNGTFARQQRLSLDDEAEALVKEFNRLAASTTFNGLSLLGGSLSQLRIQLGFGTDGGISVGVGSGLARRVGTGQFASPTTFSNGASFDTGPTAAGDFNGDGFDDLVIGYIDSGSSDYRLQVQISNGDGTFQAASDLATLSVGTTFVRVGDFNGDGRNDIALDQGTDLVVYSGNGVGGISGSTTSSIGSAAGAAQSLDVNGDGKKDLIWQLGNNVGVALGIGDGRFQAATVLDTGSFGEVAFGDINGDGQVDIAQADGASGLKVFLGAGNGTFGATSINTTGFTATRIAVADMNYDGLADIVASGAGNTVTTFLSNGTGAVTAGQSLTIGGNIGSIVLDDFNGDGYRDIHVSRTSGTRSFLTYFGNGDGSQVSTPEIYTHGQLGMYAQETADFNGDGVRDLLGDSNPVNTSFYALGSSTTATSMARVELTNMQSARDSIGLLDAVLQRVQRELGILGAAQSRISTALTNLSASRENTLAAASRIEDTDIAQQSARLIQNQILQQAAASVLAQANQQPALAIRLLAN